MRRKTKERFPRKRAHSKERKMQVPLWYQELSCPGGRGKPDLNRERPYTLRVFCKKDLVLMSVEQTRCVTERTRIDCQRGALQ